MMHVHCFVAFLSLLVASASGFEVDPDSVTPAHHPIVHGVAGMLWPRAESRRHAQASFHSSPSLLVRRTGKQIAEAEAEAEAGAHSSEAELPRPLPDWPSQAKKARKTTNPGTWDWAPLEPPESDSEPSSSPSWNQNTSSSRGDPSWDDGPSTRSSAKKKRLRSVSSVVWDPVSVTPAASLPGPSHSQPAQSDGQSSGKKRKLDSISDTGLHVNKSKGKGSVPALNLDLNKTVGIPLEASRKNIPGPGRQGAMFHLVTPDPYREGPVRDLETGKEYYYRRIVDGVDSDQAIKGKMRLLNSNNPSYAVGPSSGQLGTIETKGQLGVIDKKRPGQAENIQTFGDQQPPRWKELTNSRGQFTNSLGRFKSYQQWQKIRLKKQNELPTGTQAWTMPELRENLKEQAENLKNHDAGEQYSAYAVLDRKMRDMCWVEQCQSKTPEDWGILPGQPRPKAKGKPRGIAVTSKKRREMAMRASAMMHAARRRQRADASIARDQRQEPQDRFEHADADVEYVPDV